MNTHWVCVNCLDRLDLSWFLIIVDVSLIKALLCNSVLLHRAEAMTNRPHRSECSGPRSGVLRVCACALRALRIQVYERRERGWWEHSLLHSGTEQLKQMSLLERLDWRVRFHYSLIAINVKRKKWLLFFLVRGRKKKIHICQLPIHFVKV